MMFLVLHAGYYAQSVQIFVGHWLPGLLALHAGDVVGVW